jgi:hypothetical protein
MHKRFLLLLFLTLVLSAPLFAQLEVKEGSFKKVDGFLNINPDQNYQYDDNDLPFAVIKVRTENMNDKQRRELNFSGNAGTFIMLEYKDGEVWLYITAKYADYIKISHPDLSSIEYTLPCDLEPKKGYEMLLCNKMLVIDEESLISLIDQRLDNASSIQRSNQVGYITVRSIPKGADVYVDNIKVGETPYLSEEIGEGNHKISVMMEGYEPSAKRIDIEEGKEQEISFILIADSNYGQSSNKENTIIKSGRFSVSANRKVYFSQGNLQYKASTNTWRFADNQWDIIGYDNEKIAFSYDGWIDLFGFGTGQTPISISTNNKIYSTFVDWGNNTILNGEGQKWRTLTKEEWGYMIDRRKTNSGIRYAKATVNGICGIILLPDSWRISIYTLNKANKSGADYNNNVITQDEWFAFFESNGAVFLPAAGYRNENSIYHVGDTGCYWSCTYDGGDYANSVYFIEDHVVAAHSLKRFYGFSVRLVCE